MSPASLGRLWLSGIGTRAPANTSLSRCRGVRVATAYSQRKHLSTSSLEKTKDGRERVIVLGSGWAGFTVARMLSPKIYQVVIVSPRSYFAFTPLLASTSVGTLEFRTALEPIRSKKSDVEFLQGWADGVDFEKQTLKVEEAIEETRPGKKPPSEGKEADALLKDGRQPKGDIFEMRYDKLVVAVGCYAQTFGTPGVRENALFLKDVGDARKIRQRLLACFETASFPTTSDEMKRCILNFAVVGGGPTGVEFSAELHDIVTEDMAKLYPDLVDLVNISVYDVAPQVLSMFDKKLGEYAMRQLKREKINVFTSHHVQELRKGPPKRVLEQTGKDAADLENASYTLVTKEDGEIGIGMCVWSTGLMMNPFVQEKLAGSIKKHAKTGAVIVDEKLRIQREEGAVENVFALGDCVSVEGKQYPATAQVANQEAMWLSKRLNARDIGDPNTKGFHWKNLGVMAYLGNWNAIMQSGGSDVSGRLAWFLWRSAYLTKTVSWRNKVLIPVYWSVNWLFGRDTSRF